MKTTLLLITLFAVGHGIATAQEPDSPKPPPPAPSPPVEGGRGPTPPPPRPEQRDAHRPHPDGAPHELRRDDVRPHMNRPHPGGDKRDGDRGSILPPKPTPYLGVITSPVSPALGAQLGLPEGFGLLVDEVVDESPAAKAGLQRHDVLKLLNEQQLVDPNQLAALVRAAGKNAQVSITFFRGGKEQKVDVQVGERMMPDRRPLLPNMDDIRRNLQDWEGSFRDKLRPLQDRMREFNDRMRDFQARMREWQKNPNAGPAPTPPEPPESPRAPHGPKPGDILRETRPGGAGEIKALSNGKATTWNTAQARVFYSDDNGEIVVSSLNGKRSLVAKSKDGKIEFEGSIDTDEQRRALPEHLRKRLEKIDIQTHSGSSSASVGSDDAAAGEPPKLERDEDRDVQ
ncbi:MAG TPA: PDZ domain-containing protein [Chthoniobacteraceae bacterium]|nr:PDZ domain-containing protein [Chthoniobacteraceae bacterium]